MDMVASQQRIASAYVVFHGRYGDVSRYAQQRGVCRQWVYRQAGQVQQHLLMGGEVAANRGVVDSGTAGDCRQRHRRDTGLDGQRASGLHECRRTLAFVFLSAGAPECELRHSQNITHVM